MTTLITKNSTNEISVITVKLFLNWKAIKFCQTWASQIAFERVLAKGKKNDFRIPTWMKTLNEPSHNFNLDPPSYRELTKVIMKMKSGASPRPLDQISVIPLKKCPYLRIFLWRIISSAWTRAEFPEAWKQEMPILASKKDSILIPPIFVQ